MHINVTINESGGYHNGPKIVYLKPSDKLLTKTPVLRVRLSIITTLHVKKQNGKKESDFKHGFVLMDEQGNITERKPGEFVFHVEYNQKGNTYCLNEKTTLRLVSIPSEKRQQIIDALHKFEKKQ